MPAVSRQSSAPPARLHQERGSVAEQLRATDVGRFKQAQVNTWSAYHAFHKVQHGHETRAAYRDRSRRGIPWHIDFCFVPNMWASNVTDVRVLDDERWHAESDHHPLLAELPFD